MKKTKLYRFELRLSEESRKALSELSKKQNRSKANVVETLILKEYERVMNNENIKRTI